MDPSPPEHRTWTTWTFIAYWASDIIYPATWATVASFVTLGLTWWESCLAIFLGGILVAVVITCELYRSLISLSLRLMRSEWYHRRYGPYTVRSNFALDIRVLGKQICGF